MTGERTQRAAIAAVLCLAGCFSDSGIRTGGGGGDESSTGSDGSSADTGVDATTDTGSSGGDVGSSTTGCEGGSEELLINGGFEMWPDQNAEPMPWQVAHGGWLHWSDTSSGLNALRLTGAPGAIDDGWGIFQNIGGGPFSAGEELLFSARIKLIGGVGSSLNLSIDAAGFPQVAIPFVGSTQWEAFDDVPIVLLADSDTLPMALTSFTLDQVVVLDDVQLRRTCP